MGRGRKSKKHSSHDSVSAEDEKLPVRRRGRPQKLSRDDFDNKDDVEKIKKEDEYGEETFSSSIVDKSTVNEGSTESVKKRKLNENADSVREVVVETKTCSIKSVGYRQIGSRRKNKPRRAAEVGVECV